MAKAGRKAHEERPVKFGITAYLVPGTDDRVLQWLDDIPSHQRWREIKAKVDFALQVEQDGRPDPPEVEQEPSAMMLEILQEIRRLSESKPDPPEVEREPSAMMLELLQEIRRLSNAVSRLEDSGFTAAPAQEQPEDAPSDKAKAATARLFAKTSKK